MGILAVYCNYLVVFLTHKSIKAGSDKPKPSAKLSTMGQ